MYHNTSGENDERPGLTYFTFSMEPVEHMNNNNRYHSVIKHL